ncbi:MAG: UDP-N-acetylmuramate--L-alanine ligase [Gammaproteobacteria bacterium]|nr:UDP-N-acetylmuramate--L-alanine ligase [Gammaproteobacteria bacterium]
MKLTADLKEAKHIHLIGVGGSGMCGLARILLAYGYRVSGSDVKENNVARELQAMGAKIVFEHNAENIDGADVVVVSSAIDTCNPEIEAARSKNIPVILRAQMLGALMRLQKGIAIAGTHGKTTTTSLVTDLLREGGLNPSFVIGGMLNSGGKYADLGSGDFFVAEADESDASFLHLNPEITVVTNIDQDHMVTYADNFAKLQQTFLDFLRKLPASGLAVLCLDDPGIKQILSQIDRPFVTYGFAKDADVRVEDWQQIGTKCEFSIVRNGRDSLKVKLNLPGKHNALNALAAIAVATECGVTDADICKGLENFKGVGRRFQVYEREICYKTVTLIDDYGHHPQEIAVTVDAIRQAWPNRRLVLAFQPHRYTRTKALFKDFAEVLSEVDVLLLLDVYSAGEDYIVGADSKSLCDSIKNKNGKEVVFVKEVDALPFELQKVLKDDDVLLIQGAGSIGKMADYFISQSN